MKKLLLFATLMFFASFFPTVRAQQQNAPSSLNSQQEFIETVYWLQDNPKAPGDSTYLAKVTLLTKWVVANYSDFEVNVTPLMDFMQKNKDYKYYQEVLVLFMMGEVLHDVETKTKKNFEDAAYRGMLVAINYYNNLLKSGLADRNAAFEEFKALEERKELKAFVAQKVKNKGR